MSTCPSATLHVQCSRLWFCSFAYFLKFYKNAALAGVAPWIECGPADQRATFRVIPGLPARSPVGVCKRQSQWCFPPSLPLWKINKIFFSSEKKFQHENVTRKSIPVLTNAGSHALTCCWQLVCWGESQERGGRDPLSLTLSLLVVWLFHKGHTLKYHLCD